MEPSVFQYVDFRLFLRDALMHRRHISPKYSLETLARRTGCLTKSHLSLILAGKRGLTNQRAQALGKALSLSDGALKYYLNLVQFNQAKDNTQREHHLSAMMTSIQRNSSANIPLESYKVIENWHCLAVRELARMPNFDPTPSSVSARLKGLMSVSEARRAIKALTDTGLLTEENGSLRPSEETLRTTDEINSLAIRKYHASCLDLAKKILDVDAVEDREFGSINLILRPSEKPKLKELIKNFREQVLTLAADEGASDARVTQINIQMFDLSN